MSHFVQWTLWVVAGILLAQIVVLCAQIWAAMLPASPRRRRVRDIERPRVVVLIPANNEEAVIARTLRALWLQLREEDQALVVADNCTDDTVQLAREAGAHVLERHDEARRGKGYALAAGYQALSREFHVIIALDADCIVEDGAIDALAIQVAATGRPAQAIYLMQQTCEDASPRSRVSAFAFMVKNMVRPLGLARLRLPCQLTGAGMAFPREAIDNIDLASPNIVEDLQLGLDLALLGYAPMLCPTAHVTGTLPSDRKIALRQRRRWEHGHIRTLLVQGPRLALLGLLRGQPRAVAMAIDLMVPPLSLLVVLLVVSMVLANAATLQRVSTGPAEALLAGSAFLVVTILAAWSKFGRACLPAASLCAALPYIAWKLPMYAMFLVRPEKKWIRTDRAVLPPAAEPVGSRA